MPKKAAASPDPTPANRRKKGLEKFTVRLEPAQIEALRSEARKRAQEKGTLAADASAIVRELVAAWMKRR